jgi:bacterioferritin (cytochrome b1)
MAEEQLNNIAILWQAARLRLTDTYEVAPEILRVHGSPIGTLGNFSASIGKAKSKKTFNVSAIVAAALKNGMVLQYTAELPESKRNILYVDTEQSPYHCQKVMRRIVQMAGLPSGQDIPQLEFLALRKHTPETRIEIVEYAIYHTEGLGLVIIDGIRDMVYDINSPSESTRVVSKLMQWTDERQIHIHTVLHQNKADENARGHIGTELNNKAETVLEVTKDKTDSSISTVQAIHIRAMDFEPFAFRINDQALPELVSGYQFNSDKASNKCFDYNELTEEQHRKALQVAFSDVERMGYKELMEALRKGYDFIGHTYGDNKLVKLKTFLENKRMIVKDDTRKYSYHPDFHY